MNLVQVCNALGNETRFQIVKSLKDHSIGTCCGKIQYIDNGVRVADVVQATGLAQSTVSRHLSVLEHAGVIVREKRGQWTCFFLNNELLEAFCNETREALIVPDSCAV